MEWYFHTAMCILEKALKTLKQVLFYNWNVYSFLINFLIYLKKYHWLTLYRDERQMVGE